MCSQVWIWITGKAHEVKTFQKRCEVLRNAIRPYWVILNKAKSLKSAMWFQHQNMHSHACLNLGRVFAYHPITLCTSSTKSDCAFHYLSTSLLRQKHPFPSLNSFQPFWHQQTQSFHSVQIPCFNTQNIPHMLDSQSDLTLHYLSPLHLCRNSHALWLNKPLLATIISEIQLIPLSMPCAYFTFPEFVQTIHFWQIPLTCCSKGTCILIKQTTSLQTLSMPWEQHLRNPFKSSSFDAIPSLMPCHLS